MFHGVSINSTYISVVLATFGYTSSHTNHCHHCHTVTATSRGEQLLQHFAEIVKASRRQKMKGGHVKRELAKVADHWCHRRMGARVRGGSTAEAEMWVFTRRETGKKTLA